MDIFPEAVEASVSNKLPIYLGGSINLSLNRPVNASNSGK
jgi:hypothetical protein